MLDTRAIKKDQGQVCPQSSVQSMWINLDYQVVAVDVVTVSSGVQSIDSDIEASWWDIVGRHVDRSIVSRAGNVSEGRHEGTVREGRARGRPYREEGVVTRAFGSHLDTHTGGRRGGSSFIAGATTFPFLYFQGLGSPYTWT